MARSLCERATDVRRRVKAVVGRATLSPSIHTYPHLPRNSRPIHPHSPRPAHPIHPHIPWRQPTACLR